MGLPPLCTVGAAELAWPLALGNIALFSIAMESAVFCSLLPGVAAPVVVVQLISFCGSDGTADCAMAALINKELAKMVAATR